MNVKLRLVVLHLHPAETASLVATYLTKSVDICTKFLHCLSHAVIQIEITNL